jgi:hypothetical protein
MNPNYPIYIVSKGRWKTRFTSKYLEWMGVPYHIIVEPQEYDNYASVISPSKILTMPKGNLGFGSIPARNFAWEHSLSIGASSHWCLDDNIRGFTRLNRNENILVATGTIFKVAEDFVDRYENIALASFAHRFSGGGKNRKKPPFKLNTTAYSCILIKNNIPFRWRGKYNEDADISIRVLKAGWCTVAFHCFLANKPTTLTTKGGNTDELYANDGLQKRAEYLQKEFPDIVKVAWRFGRWQHVVSYKVFKNNKLIKKKGVIIPKGVNNYGMVIKEYED